jgi:pimeloyl-ACP methyl ester carboxylesterase
VSDEHTDTKYVVTLVHGTFAPAAAWCEPTSKLSVALTEKLGPGCVAKAFRWSGKNLHSARLEAGRSLAAFLAGITEEYPNARHFVVAHSHGGNVALYALRDARLQQKIRGVVCMATPFLRCEARDVTKTLGRLDLFILPVVALLAAFLAGILMLILAGLMGLVLDEALPQEFWWLLVGVAFLFFIAFTLTFGPRLERHIHDPLHRILFNRQTRVLELYSPPFIESAGVLTVSTPLDEAGVVLRLWRFLGNIPFRCWQPEIVLFPCLALEVLLLISFAFFTLPDVVSELETLRLSGLGLTRIAGMFMGLFTALIAPFLVFVLYALVIHVLMWLAPRLIRSHFLAFGGETAWDNLLVDISTSTTPPAQRVEEARRWVSRFAGGSGFRFAHCAVYDDEQMISRIVDWIDAASFGGMQDGRRYRTKSAVNPLGL